MFRKMIVFLFCFIFFVEPQQRPIRANIQIYNEDIFSITLPDWASSCNRIPVYSQPNINSKVVRYLHGKSVIRIRYGSKDNNFANIAPAQWVKTIDLCEAD